jgi:hypothetical protein
MTGWQIAITSLNLHGPMSSLLQARPPFMLSRAFYCGFRGQTFFTSMHLSFLGLRNIYTPSSPFCYGRFGLFSRQERQVQICFPFAAFAPLREIF